MTEFNKAHAKIRVPLILLTIVLWIITFVENYLKWRSQSPVNYTYTFCFCYPTKNSFFAVLLGCPLFWASLVLTTLTVLLELTSHAQRNRENKQRSREIRYERTMSSET
jgi:hypothetical protein